jgi:hypothetical protein
MREGDMPNDKFLETVPVDLLYQALETERAEPSLRFL